MHEQEVGGILLLTDLLRDASRHRNGGNAGGTDQRIDLAACHLVHDLAEEHAEGGTHAERDQTEKDDLERLEPEEVGAGGGSADSGAEEDGDDIHQFILRRLGDTLDHAALLEEVAEHEHTDQRSRVGKQNGDHDDNDDREHDLFQLGHRTELFHNDGALLLGGEQLHDGRLDDGHQRHVGIRRDRDGAEQMGREFGGDVDRRRAVGAADNADSAGFRLGKAEEDRAGEGDKDTDLRGSAEDQALGVGDQRTEVGHAADAEEDQRRIDAELDALIEIVEQAAVLGIFIIDLAADLLHDMPGGSRIGGVGDLNQTDMRRRHDRGIEIDEQHTEGDGQQEQRLILLFDGEIEQEARNRDHHIILPSQGQDAGAFEQTFDGFEKTIEYFHNLISFPFSAVKTTGYYPLHRHLPMRNGRRLS